MLAKSSSKTYFSHSPEETKQIAQNIAQSLDMPAVICLYGDLGSGKTTFSKGFGMALGIQEKKIKSPTYAFVRSHHHKKGIFHHFDLYRLDKPDSFLIHEIQEMLQETNVTIIIEWPERISNILPKKRIDIYLSHEEEETRKISIKNRP